MAQHDYSIANGTGSAVRSDLNDALAAIVSLNSGATEPASTFSFQLWADTTANVLKLRNSANNAWITLRQLDGDFTTVSVDNGTAAAPSVFFNASGTDTGFYSSGTDAVDVSTAGTRRLGVGSAGDVTVFGGNVTLNAQGDLRFADSDSSNWVAFQAPATVASNVTWTLPSADGTADQALVTNGSGTLSWADAGGASDAITEGNTSAEVVDTGSDGHFKVITEGTEAIRVDSSQRVLIGNTSAGGTGRYLTVGNTSSANTYLEIRSSTSGDGGLTFADSAGGARGLVGYSHGTDALDFWANGSLRTRIDSSGRLLLGVSSSSADARLVVAGSTTPYDSQILMASTGNQPSVNTKIGGIKWSDNRHDSNIGAEISCYSDASWGGSVAPGRLVFSTTTYTAASPEERMVIDGNGYVTIKKNNSTNLARLHFNGASTRIEYSDQSGHLTFYTNSAARVRVNYLGGFIPVTDNSMALGAGGERWTAVYAVNGTIQTSDEREKTDIAAATLGSDFIKQLRPVSYKWKVGENIVTKDEDGETDVVTPRPGERTHWGFIAQEVKQAVDAAGVDFGGWILTDKDDPDSTQGLRYDQFIAPLTKALQEALAKIETLETANASLEARLTALENA